MSHAREVFVTKLIAWGLDCVVFKSDRNSKRVVTAYEVKKCVGAASLCIAC